MLLADQPYPAGMNKAKILFLAQRRALKGESDKEESLDDASDRRAIPEGTLVSSRGPSTEERAISLKRTRLNVPEGSGKKFLQGRCSVEGDPKKPEVLKDEGVVELIPSKGVSILQGGPSHPVSKRGEGTEKCTLLRFQSGPGWLGKTPGPTAPIAALGAFELSPDQKILDFQNDEEVVSRAKDALGVVRFFFKRSLVL